MVYAMHIGRHNEQPKHTIHSRRHPDIAMVEHARGVEQDLEDQDGDRRRPQQDDGCRLDAHGKQDFDRVEPQAGGHVEIQVGVMHHV